MNGHKTIIARAGNMAFSKGILVINSAGNDGNDQWHYIATPADGDSILAIGAVDSTGTITNFSSRGPGYLGQIKPDLCAQGGAVLVINAYSGYPAYSGGTSFSCPIMAGCAASLWSAFPDKSAREIRDALVISADRYLRPDSTYGYGIPNLYNAFLFLKTNYNGQVLHFDGESAIYPNPFSDQLKVSFYNETAGEHTIDIYNLLGEKMYTQKLYVRDKTFEIVDLNGVGALNEGEYIIRLDGNRNLAKTIFKYK
jgi:subtilisin family serine protease